MADAARRDIRNAPILETEAHIGDILAPAEHGNTHGIQTHQRRAHEVQNDFYIMDHEVEDHANIRAAIRVGRKPSDLQKTRILQLRLQCMKNGIESLHMPDLEHASLPGGRLRQFAGVRGRVGDGFFNEQMLASCEKLHARGVMSYSRRANRRGIDQTGEFLER